MEGKAFIKLCKDCKLMSKALTTTDIDLIFAKVSAWGLAVAKPAARPTGVLLQRIRQVLITP